MLESSREKEKKRDEGIEGRWKKIISISLARLSREINNGQYIYIFYNASLARSLARTWHMLMPSEFHLPHTHRPAGFQKKGRGECEKKETRTLM
jgi:hypothetical protein